MTKDLGDNIENRFADEEILRSELGHCFNFKFWEPVECIGGKVYFGSYYKHTYILRSGRRSETTLQTPEQIMIKGRMGLI